MKKNISRFFISVASLHFLFILCFCMSSGCRNQQILETRSYIPAPVMIPQPVPMKKEEIEVDVAIETVPKEKEFSPFPEVKPEPLKYTVKKGDSFWKIARLYGVSMNELAEFNHLSLNKHLISGKVLSIPPGGRKLSPEEIVKPKKKRTSIKPKKTKTKAKLERKPLPNDGVYVVKKGDSLWKIAVTYGLKVSSIAKANNLDIKKPLIPGQKLILPGTGPLGGGRKPESPDKATEEILNMATTEDVELIDDAPKSENTPKPLDADGKKAAPAKKSDEELLKETTSDISSDIIDEITTTETEEDKLIEEDAKELLKEIDDKKKE